MRRLVLRDLDEPPAHPVREALRGKRAGVERIEELAVVRALEVLERERELQDLRDGGRRVRPALREREGKRAGSGSGDGEDGVGMRARGNARRRNSPPRRTLDIDGQSRGRHL